MSAPLRILIAALGGEGGGVLMNWIVEAARGAGFAAQATSVPGVAQRTGSTSYYIEIERDAGSVLGLVPMPGRVDVLVSSELVETARALAAGYVSPRVTTVISSTARALSTVEKMSMGDGRYDPGNVRRAIDGLSKTSFLLDLGKLAEDNGTFVSATMFGALAGSDVLPWGDDMSRAVLSDDRSRGGFDAACRAVRALKASEAAQATDEVPGANIPDDIQLVIDLGHARCVDFQDDAYGADYRRHAQRLLAAADPDNVQAMHAVKEACRRLALWMTYEDIARVADLKTRRERFERIGAEVRLEPGQILTITEYLKPRAEEIADILPAALGRRVMARVASGKGFPLLGRGLHVRSNGVIGHWMLRFVATLRRFRRGSLRFGREQADIETWLRAMETTLPRSPAFADGLAELPRVLKGYSDTLERGKTAYARIMTGIVEPAMRQGSEADQSDRLRAAIGAAMADDTHAKLDAVLASGEPGAPVPDLKAAANA